jgi:ubiquinone/menaquinone biosynthesis C-methylase UbiE
MEPQMASALTNAILQTQHPRNDFRTEEARRYTQWMVDYAKSFILPGGRLIDLGCAAGKQTFQAEALGARVIGLDCAFEALNFAQTVRKDIGSQAKFVRGNYVRTPFASESFDTVLFPKNLVECSYAEADRLADEITRILKPGGQLILTLPDSLRKFAAQPDILLKYSPQTGASSTKVQIPGQGEFENTGYFWTCGYAVHLFCRFMQLVKIQEIEEATYLMIFAKRPDWPGDIPVMRSAYSTG